MLLKPFSCNRNSLVNMCLLQIWWKLINYFPPSLHNYIQTDFFSRNIFSSRDFKTYTFTKIPKLIFCIISYCFYAIINVRNSSIMNLPLHSKPCRPPKIETNKNKKELVWQESLSALNHVSTSLSIRLIYLEILAKNQRTSCSESPPLELTFHPPGLLVWVITNNSTDFQLSGIYLT